MARFQNPGERPVWRAGIFHGLRNGKPLGQTGTPATTDPIVERIASGIEEGAERAADVLEDRYSGKTTLLFGLLAITALATTVTAIVVASRD